MSVSYFTLSHDFFFFKLAVCVFEQCVCLPKVFIDVIFTTYYLLHYSVLNMIYCSVIIMITLIIIILFIH